MPGFVLHLGATVTCAHGGQATPTAPNPRVLLSGQAVCTVPPPYGIAGCPLNVSGSPVPCVTGTWTSGSTRVTVLGQPVALISGTSTCAPNGTPMLVTASQARVTAM